MAFPVQGASFTVLFAVHTVVYTGAIHLTPTPTPTLPKKLTLRFKFTLFRLEILFALYKGGVGEVDQLHPAAHSLGTVDAAAFAAAAAAASDVADDQVNDKVDDGVAVGHFVFQSMLLQILFLFRVKV